MLADIKTAVVADDLRLLLLKSMAKLLSLSVKAEIILCQELTISSTAFCFDETVFTNVLCLRNITLYHGKDLYIV